MYRPHDFTGEYKLIVEREHHLDLLTVEVERSTGFAGSDAELATRFARQLQSVTGVTAKVNILPPDTLPRAMHKAKRMEGPAYRRMELIRPRSAVQRPQGATV